MTEEKSAKEAMTPEKAIEHLQKVGLAKGLTASVFKQIALELCHEEGFENDFPVVSILDAYYCDEKDGAARAQEDGYIRHDWRFGQETSDAVAELAALVGTQPILRQLGYRTEKGETLLGVRRDDGVGLSIEVRSLDDIVALFNVTLQERRDERRFFSLDTEEDWHAYLLLTHYTADHLTSSLPFDQFEDNCRPPVPSLKRFETWPGEIKPSYLQEFARPEGIAKFRGQFALVSNKADDYYATADLEKFPPVFERRDGEFVVHIDRARDGSRLICAAVKSEKPPYVFRPSVCSGSVWTDPSLPAEASEASISEAYFVNDSVVAFPPQGGKLERPLIGKGDQLAQLSSLPARARYSVNGVVRRNEAGDVLIWNGDGYELIDGQWLCTFKLGIKSPTGTFLWSSTAAGEDGFFYINDFMLYEVHGCDEPKPHLKREFCAVKPGPDGGLLLVWATNENGNVGALYYPSNGSLLTKRLAILNQELFGNPQQRISDLYYCDDGRKIIALCADQLLAVPVDQVFATITDSKIKEKVLQRIEAATDEGTVESMIRNPTEFNWEPLPFYQNFQLLHATISLRSKPVVYTYADDGSRVFSLYETSAEYLSSYPDAVSGEEQIYAVNKLENLYLDAGQVPAYLRFFFATITKITLVEGSQDVNWYSKELSQTQAKLKEQAESLILSPMKITPTMPTWYNVVATGYRRQQLIELDLSVSRAGEVKIKSERNLLEQLPIVEII